ncbi:serine hydrolase domain-containing protein [Ascidiimonas sp. W6]|uniref:serine hydrolase domain-containing protein n=1 Tax=Ascidiimonas meishanensis TaxID=3128903 RepID=UPI0030EE5E9F
MKQFNLITSFLISITLLLSSCANDDNSTPKDDFDRAKMDLLFSTLEDKGFLMGASISISKNNREVYQRSIGLAEFDNTIPISSQTKFKIGSMTETFTACMILQLVEEGKLALNTPLSNYYPEMPNSSTITIEYLLRHRSGLVNYVYDPDFSNWGTQAITEAEFIERFIEYGTSTEPYTVFEYSNTNYVLLGFIIEKIDGKSYADALEDRITNRINLSNTYYYGETINTTNNEALSYDYWNDTWNPSPQFHASVWGGAGAIMSTPTDLNTFYEALFEDKIITEASLSEMTKNIDWSAGMGIFSGMTISGKPFIVNFGDIDNFSSITFYFPEEDVCMSYITNGLNFQRFDEFLEFNIPIAFIDIYFGEDYTIPIGE